VCIDDPADPPDQGRDRRADLNRRLRRSFVEAAEEDPRRALGRGLTDESWRGPSDYPGDVVERSER